MPLNPQLLENLLKNFGVETLQWGKGEAKTVADFFQELVRGESYLRIDGEGIFRVTEIVKMFISKNLAPDDGLLLEWGQYLPDDRYRERQIHPAGKMKRGESPEEALLREAKEELGISRHDLCELSRLPLKVESRAARSYPGLECLYLIHGFKMVVVSGAEICQQSEFTRTEEDGTKLVFKWVK